MADESRKRLTMTLNEPDTPGKTFTVPLKGFTPQVFEDFTELEAERQIDGADSLDEFRNADESKMDPTQRAELVRKAARTAARLRLVSMFRRAQFIVDADRITVDQHRAWVGEDPEAEFGFWRGQMDLTRLETGIRSFRELLGIANP